MTTTDNVRPSSRRTRRFGNIALQIALVAVVGGLAYAAAENAARHLANAHIASGFGFWHDTAGFDISQTLIAYSASTSTFGRAFWVGLLNTLLVVRDRHRARDRARLCRRARRGCRATGSWRAWPACT